MSPVSGAMVKGMELIRLCARTVVQAMKIAASAVRIKRMFNDGFLA
jgi:hypothetical protein